MYLKLIRVFFLFGLGKIGTLIFTAMIVYVSSIEMLGATMTSISVCLGAVLLSKFGSDVALIKNCSIYKDEGLFKKFSELISFSIVLLLKKSIFISLTLFFCLSLFENSFVKNQLYFVSILFPMFSLLTLFGSVLKSINKQEIASFTDLGFVTLLTSLILYIYYLCNSNINEITIILIFFTVTIFILISVIIYLCISKYRFRFYFTCNLKEEDAFKDSLFDYFIPGFSHYLIQWGGVLIISILLTTKDVGLFSAAQRVSYLVNFILIVMNSILAPKYAILYKENRIKDIENYAVKSSTFMSIFSMVVIFSIILFSSLFDFMGSEISGTILLILMTGQFINVSTGSVSFLLNMTGHEYEMRNIMILATSTTLILLLLFVPFFGILGAAVALSSGLILQNVLATYTVFKLLGIKSLPMFIGKYFYGEKK